MEIVGLEDKTNAQIRELLKNGGKVVYFTYTISMIFFTQTKSSSLFYIAPNQGRFSSHGYKYFLLSLFFGWWGFPWGPIYTIGSLFSALFGGKNITKDVLESLENEFQAKLDLTTREIDKDDIEFLNIDIKGIIRGRKEGYNAQFVINLFDITDGEREPILSLSEEYQYQDSRIFFYVSDKIEMPYIETLFQEWVTVTSIPTLFLEFPRKGERKLEIEIQIIDEETYILDKITKIITYKNEENGYLDNIDNQYKFEEALIKTALLVSASDGDMDNSEAEVIKNWVKIRLTGYNEESKDENKKRLNSYISDAYRQINNNQITINDTLQEIDTITSEGEKYELFELCLKVAGADNQADANELKILDEIANRLNLHKEKLQKMLEKELPITIHAEELGNKESMIGITPNMSEKEIKKHLRKEYTKWNARVSNADPKIREQANEMIKIIVELRAKYK
jgi:tellurite resistance protein